MDKIKNWFKPPTFEDAEKTHVASLLHYVLSTSIILLSAYLIIQLALGMANVTIISIILLSFLIVIFIGLKIAMNRGHVRATSYTLVTSAWIIMFLIAWDANGIKDPSFLAFTIIILITGFLLGWKAGIFITLLTILAGWFLVYAEFNGYLSVQDIPSDLFAIDITLIFIIIAALLSLLINTLNTALKQARQNEQSLTQINQEFQTIQDQLEIRIAQSVRDLALAAEIGRNISQIRDLNELLTFTVDRIGSRFDLYYAQIYLADDYGAGLTLAAGTGAIGKALLTKGHHLAVDTRSISGLAATEKKPVIVEDTAQSPLFQPNPALPYTRSEMAIPLIAGGRVLGVIDLQSREPQGLNEKNLPAFEALAGQLAVSIENAALFKEQERLTNDLQNNAHQLIKNSTFLDSIIDNIPLLLFVKDAKDLKMQRWNKMSTDYFGITEAEIIGKSDYDTYPTEEANIYYAQDRKVLDEGVAVEIPEEARITTKGERILRIIKTPIFGTDGAVQYLLGIAEDITEQKEAERLLNERMKELNLLNAIRRKSDEQLSVPDFLAFVADSIPAGMQFPEFCKAAITLDDEVYGSPEAVDLPTQIVEGLRIDGKLVGRIYIAYTEKHAFLNEESALIGNIGRRVTDYITNQRLSARIQSTVRGLQTVAEVGTAVAMTLDTKQLLQEVVDLAKAKFGFYHAHIYQYNTTSKFLVLTASAGEIGQKIVAEGHQIPFAAPQSLVARAARKRKGLVVENVHVDPGFLPHSLLPDTQSELAVPLVAGTELIGVMDIQSDKLNGFTEEDVNIQTTLAAQIAVALQNARQYEHTQEALEEVQTLQQVLTREGWETYLTAVNRPVQGYEISENKLKPIIAGNSDLPANGKDKPDTIAYPLAVQGTPIGQLGIKTVGRELSEQDLDLLESISEQVAEALDRTRLFEETETARSQTEALFSGSQQVVRAANMTEILHAIINATQIQQYERANMFFFDRLLLPGELAENVTVTAVWSKDGQPNIIPVGSKFPIDHYPIFKHLDRKNTLLVDDVSVDKRFDGKMKTLLVEQLNMRSILAVPLVIGDSWLGFIISIASEPQHLNADDIRQIVSLAGQAATVAQSQRLYAEAESRAKHEQILRQVSDQVYAAPDAATVLRTAAREIGQALGVEAYVYLDFDETEEMIQANEDHDE